MARLARHRDRNTEGRERGGGAPLTPLAFIFYGAAGKDTSPRPKIENDESPFAGIACGCDLWLFLGAPPLGVLCICSLSAVRSNLNGFLAKFRFSVF